MATIELAKYVAPIDLDDSGLMKGLDRSDKQLNNKMGNLSKWLKISVAGGIAAVGTAIAGTVASGVKATNKLDEELSKFKATTGATADEVEAIRKLSQDLYKVNTDSMEDIVATSEALKQSMGLTVDEIGKYQQSYMDYAKVTGQANDKVVKDIAQVGRAWGLTAEESVGSLDMLKKSAQDFGTDLGSVQKALQDVAPSAKALGLNIEETNGFMNMMAKAGLDANQSISAFNNAARQVESPEEFRRMLKDIQAIEDPTERAQKAVELFGSRAGVAMSNVLDGTNDLDAFIVTMQEAEGTVNSASNAFDSNFNVQWDLAKKQVGGLVQELGEKFMPVVNDVLKWFIDSMPKIVGIIEKSIDFIGMILNPFIELIRFVISIFQDLELSTSDSFGGIRDTISGVIESITNIISIFIEMASAFWDKWGKDILEFTQRYFGLIKENIESVLNIIKGVFDFFTALFKGDWEGMGQALLNITKNIWKLIENTFKIAIESIKLVLKIAIDTFKTLAKAIMNGLWDGLKFVWNTTIQWFEDIFTNLFSWFRGLGSTFVQIGKDMFNSIWEGMKSIWTGLKNWVSNTISWLTDKLFFWRKSKSEIDSSQAEVNAKTTTNTTSGMSVPAYASGASLIKNDGLALIHKGEAVVPAYANPWNPSNKNGSLGGSKVEMNIDSLLTINGNVDESIMPQLERFGKKLKNEVFATINNNLKKKGF
ncbi:TP901 family phage tail tape measure protein [Natranaerovirga pectinivora]|uniref:TP901 family phage tail tape measure protein n=1 Tax=Natranaerovirga pectinivora TaxID=682400 RepID=A0A4V2V0K5_9FIRM|nr:phage tail tape measure protein [Natranaerovirga pectinivora]TCT16407.1 TP901 family phage tail tape measure protein [Natranaerovirga pectinivora]